MTITNELGIKKTSRASNEVLKRVDKAIENYWSVVFAPLENASVDEINLTIDAYKEDMFFMLLLTDTSRKMLNKYARKEPVRNFACTRYLIPITNIFGTFTQGTLRPLREATLNKLYNLRTQKIKEQKGIM